jgi:hypothetical protein
MSRRTELFIIALVSISVASGVSHLAAGVIKFRTQAVQPMMFGEAGAPVGATTAGSSITFYGINWSVVAKDMGTRIRAWAVPGASVEEMEVLQRSTPAAASTFLGISAQDMNNNYLSEFHSAVVSLRESLTNLRESGVGWSYEKRVLSQYPLRYLRILFPTAGRSTHVMVGMREGLRLLRHRGAAEPSERAVITNESNIHGESISEWPVARGLRQIGDARSSATGTFEFNGPKRQALFRFLRRGAVQGKMIVVVLPESPLFRQELLSAGAVRQFKALLAEARERTPEAIWVRLDEEPSLNSNDLYWDLVHLNAPGQTRATELLLGKLRKEGIVK